MTIAYKELATGNIYYSEEIIEDALEDCTNDAELLKEVVNLFIDDFMLSESLIDEAKQLCLDKKDEFLEWYYGDRFIKIKLDENGEEVHDY